MSRVEPFLHNSTAGFLHVPAEPCNQGLVLTHGAGANCQAPLLVAVANAFANSGFHVLCCDLAFRKRRPTGPPHPFQAAEDRSGLLADVAVMRGMVSGHVLLGGHSYGGRQASILCSEDRSLCDALLLLSYPLHPPNKPDQLRTAHFDAMKTPCLFVHGTKDTFGTVGELRAALKLIPVPVELSVIENAGHDLKGGRFDIEPLVIELMRKLAGISNPMCRSIKLLNNPGQSATSEELSNAALQFVRKISGYRKPSRANEEAFQKAVLEIAEASQRLLSSTARPARKRIEAVESEGSAAK